MTCTPTLVVIIGLLLPTTLLGDAPGQRVIPEVRRQKLPAAQVPSAVAAPARNRVLNAPGAPLGMPAEVNQDRFNVHINNRDVILENKAIDESDQEARPLVPRFGRVNIQAMALASENFDLVLFGNSGTPPQHRAQLHTLLNARIKGIERRQPLNKDQRRLLQLAGSGDIQRYLDRVALARREFEDDRLDYNRGMAALDRLGPLAREFTEGPFLIDSLVTKTARTLHLDTHPSSPKGRSTPDPLRPTGAGPRPNNPD